MNTVLAAIDSGVSGQPVLSTAAALAALLDATVASLHVREPGLGTPAGLARAEGVKLDEVCGTPAQQILAAAQDPEVVALVLGSGGTNAAAAPTGQTVIDVITRVTKPVAVVPPDADPPKEIKRILVPLEGAHESSRALGGTIELARERGLEVLVLHIHSPSTVPAFSDHAPHAARAWDKEFLTRHVSTPHDHIMLLRRVGVAADDVVAVARESGCDLIVMAWSQNLAAGHARVVSEALAHSDTPVLLIPVQ